MFITLIALAALMISAVALVRNVDTAAMIAGNLAFKQSATASADRGVQQAMANIVVREAANSLDADAPSAGYHASITSGIVLAENGSAWMGANHSPDINDAAGNKSNYVIQRMSRAAGPCTDANCLFNASSSDNSEHAAGEPPPPPPGMKKLVLYRITVRTEGPRGTVSFVQAFAN